MGESITTRLDEPYTDADTRAAAIRVLTRRGATDLIEILGLTEPAPAEDVALAAAPADSRCPQGHKLPSHGVCRRAERCRAQARERGVHA